MPIEPTYPGVYVDELPSSRPTVAGVPTASTAFVDVFERGPDNVPTPITSMVEFESTFGGLIPESRASRGIRQFFVNGGSVAWVVRVPGMHAAVATAPAHPLGEVAAVGSGAWGNDIQVAVEQNGSTFDVVVRELGPAVGAVSDVVTAVETYRDLSTNDSDPNQWARVINAQSSLIRVDPTQHVPPAVAPTAPVEPTASVTAPTNATDPEYPGFTNLTGGTDDFDVTVDMFGSAASRSADPAVPATGMFTLGEMAPPVFNLLCLPAMAGLTPSDWSTVFDTASAFCERHRAFFIADPPACVLNGTATEQVAAVREWFEGTGGGAAVADRTSFGAVYFPRLRTSDPAPHSTGAIIEVEASGAMAGLYAMNDAVRGVWKAPAGTQAAVDVLGPAVVIDDADNTDLNTLGINAIRQFPMYGTLSWGARTIAGGDTNADEFKYVNVRRLASYIEVSLEQGTRWAVFEPNDEPLWSALRLSIDAFLQNLFREGAFAGSSPSDAYFVRCDSTTTTPSDREQGVVNIQVGFAPLFPAEFVVLTISQTAAS